MKTNILIYLLIIFVAANLVAQQPGTEKWSFTTGGIVNSSPAIGPDGTVYVGSHDNKLYALNPDGTEKWSIFVGNVSSYFAIGSDGTVYGTSSTYLFAVNPDGTSKWFIPVKNSLLPAIGSDGTLYVGASNIVYALNSDGTEKWSFTTGAPIWSSPAIGSDGTVYVGSMDLLYALNPDGTEKWSNKIGPIIRSSPAIGSDSTIYVGPWINKLYALNPDGTEKWSFTSDDWIITSPVIGSDGTIYVGSEDYKLYALNPDGTEKWSFAAGDHLNSSPAIGSDSTVYVGSGDLKVYALNPDGTEKWSFATAGPVSSSPAIGSEGTLYIGADSMLYAIHTSSKGLAQSAWPKFRKDNQNRANTQMLFPPDHIPPSPVSDLSVKKLSDGVFTLLWTATGDDNKMGNATNYNIRFSMSAPDTNLDSWWLRTHRVTNMPKPASADSRDSVVISNFQEGTYYFALKVGDEVGNWSSLSNIIEVSNQIIGITTIDKFPTKYHLFQNHPNPFNATTRIDYSLPERGFVSINIFSIDGTLVSELFRDIQNPGNYSINWDAGLYSTGTYLIQLKVNNFTSIKKCILIK